MKKIFLLIVAALSMFILTSCAYTYTAPKGENIFSSVENPNVRYDSNFVQISLFTHPGNTIDSSLLVRKGTIITQKQLEDKLHVTFSFPYSPKPVANYWLDENGRTFDFSKPIEKSMLLKADYQEQDITLDFDLNPDKSNAVKKTWKSTYTPPTVLKLSDISNFQLPTNKDIVSPGFEFTAWLYNNEIVPDNQLISIKNKIIQNINAEREKAKAANNGVYDPAFKPTLSFKASYISRPFNIIFTVPKNVPVYDASGNKLTEVVTDLKIRNGQLPEKQTVDNGGILAITPYTTNVSVNPGFGYTFKGWIYVDPSGAEHILNNSNANRFVVDFLPDDNNNITFIPYIVKN